MKLVLYISITLGGIIGSYIPVIFFHVDAFSIWSIVFAAFGSFISLWIGYKIYTNLG